MIPGSIFIIEDSYFDLFASTFDYGIAWTIGLKGHAHGEIKNSTFMGTDLPLGKKKTGNAV
jgi:hypothetical protein